MAGALEGLANEMRCGDEDPSGMIVSEQNSEIEELCNFLGHDPVIRSSVFFVPAGFVAISRRCRVDGEPERQTVAE